MGFFDCRFVVDEKVGRIPDHVYFNLHTQPKRLNCNILSDLAKHNSHNNKCPTNRLHVQKPIRRQIQINS